ncbi:hypothetical protein CPB83DRAFT_894919 [Crepidotus variabilis]|uniref:Uncharacterized protein n=1 Tax=Crepidotus variabilis TaxID=179855 RepID=A0A9P6JPM5_9AGAR|nr:hypothetical protein CPB83DRAFT_894919 [Crepidotus variabilis]
MPTSLPNLQRLYFDAPVDISGYLWENLIVPERCIPAIKLTLDSESPTSLVVVELVDRFAGLITRHLNFSNTRFTFLKLEIRNSSFSFQGSPAFPGQIVTRSWWNSGPYFLHLRNSSLLQDLLIRVPNLQFSATSTITHLNLRLSTNFNREEGVMTRTINIMANLHSVTHLRTTEREIEFLAGHGLSLFPIL